MNPYREPSKPTSRLREFFVNRVLRISPLTVVLAAFIIAGVAFAATSALRINGVLYGVKDGASWVPAFGAKGDGTTDDTAAIQAAVTATEGYAGATSSATSQTPAAVYFPAGLYKVTGPITMHQGTRLIGAAMAGSNWSGTEGTAIIQYSAGNLFVWDGNNSRLAGTGGGIENMTIAKAAGYDGGKAIYLTSSDDSHRPGEFVIQNVGVYTVSTGYWQSVLYIDGSANNTPGTYGIRDIGIYKLRGAGCDQTTYPGDCIHLKQFTHLYVTQMQLDTGNGIGTPAVTIDGNFDQLYVASMEINGTVLISQPPDGTYFPTVFMRGRAGTSFTNNATTVVGMADLNTASATNSSSSMNIKVAGVSMAQSGTWTNSGGLVTVKDASSPISGDLFVVQDSIGNKYLDVTDNSTVTVKPNVADGSSAVGMAVNTINALSTSGAKLFTLANAGTLKFNVDLNGNTTAGAGAGTASGKVPVTLYSDTTVTPSVTTGETFGSSYTMPANTLSVNGQEIHCTAAWTHAANTNSVTAKLYFNGVGIANFTSTTSGDVMGSEYKIVRTTSSTATYHGFNMNNSGALNGSRGTLSTQNFAGSIVIDISVQGATTNGDLSTNYLRCEWVSN